MELSKNDDLVLVVPVKSLASCCVWLKQISTELMLPNTLSNEEDRVSAEEIKEAIDANNLRCEPVEWHNEDVPRIEHAKRIAHFVKNGWPDPIDVDVGCPSLGYNTCQYVIDGHHRLAAAIYRGDETIIAAVSGELEFAEELFSIKITGEERLQDAIIQRQVPGASQEAPNPSP